jgi:ribosomal protein L3 glutamine methyltransferase
MRVPADVGGALDWITNELARHDLWYGHGTDNPRDEAVALVMGVLGLPFDALRTNRALAPDQRKQLELLLTRRIADRVPVPYLVGEAWFCGHRFVIDESVLIPRSPIAELIQDRFRPWIANDPAKVLDLCAGSGCIGIACALALENTHVVLSDVSPAALEVARRNVALHRLDDRVEVREGDLFGAVPGERFDLIVSNPPYVDASDFAALPSEYRHEPALALAAGTDGLAVVRRILDEARAHLTERGVLVVEVGNSVDALVRAFPQLPFVWPDFQSGPEHDVFVLQKADLR